MNQSAAALSRSFAPTDRFENLEIRKGFLQFSNLNSEQNPSLTALAIESEVPLKRTIHPSALSLRGRMIQRPGGTLWRCRSATNLEQFGNKNGRFSRKTCHFCAIARSTAMWQSLSQRHGIPWRSTGARSKKESLSQKT